MRALLLVVPIAAFIAAGPAEARQATPQDLFRAEPGTYAPRYDPAHQPPAPVAPSIVIPDGPSAPAMRAVSQSGREVDAAAQGYLSLVVEPVSAQIYVDGFFVGTIDDYAGSPGPLLAAGTHRIELRAAGYAPLAFAVRIVAGQVVTRRDDLARVAGPAAAPPAAADARRPSQPPSRTFYVIPRCYAGDTPPRAAHLPAGCRLSDVRTVPAAALVDR